jgi:hypothetical protein
MTGRLKNQEHCRGLPEEPICGPHLLDGGHILEAVPRLLDEQLPYGSRGPGAWVNEASRCARGRSSSRARCQSPARRGLSPCGQDPSNRGGFPLPRRPNTRGGRPRWCCYLWPEVGRLASTGMVSASEVRARRCAAGIILTRAAVDKRHLDHTSLLPMSDSDASCELSARIDDRIETECE